MASLDTFTTWASNTIPTLLDSGTGKLQSKLEELKKLKESGELTEDEYTRARKNALGI